MAFTVINANEVDAKSPLTDSLGGVIKADLDHLKSAITDGASAAQNITANNITGEDVTVNGTLSVGAFFSSEQLLFLYW